MFEGMMSGRRVLDIAGAKQRGAELYKFIENEVAHTQSIVVQQLPNVLIMDIEQFNDQAKLFNIIETEDVTLYKTQYNIMEIEVKDDRNA